VNSVGLLCSLKFHNVGGYIVISLFGWVLYWCPPVGSRAHCTTTTTTTTTILLLLVRISTGSTSDTPILLFFTSMQPLHATFYKKYNTMNSNKAAISHVAVSYYLIHTQWSTNKIVLLGSLYMQKFTRSEQQFFAQQQFLCCFILLLLFGYQNKTSMCQEWINYCSGDTEQPFTCRSLQEVSNK
jgi:hypothetical protein